MSQHKKHVLGLSGGKDSAALAVYMNLNYPELDIDYFFTDTGKELPEVYTYLDKLEGMLGKDILRLNPDKGFEYWLKQFNNFLPSPQSRWCTRQLKLKPFLDWVRPMLNNGIEVHSYVAIRSDEPYREGMNSKDDNLIVHLPFRIDGIDRAGVEDLLEGSGLGMPDYYKWRSRSGCTFCFYQQKIEWARLKEYHPEAFEEAMRLEKTAAESGSPFTWSEGESLADLARPARIEQIEADFQIRKQKALAKQNKNPLRPQDELSIDDIYGQAKYCVACHK